MSPDEDRARQQRLIDALTAARLGVPTPALSPPLPETAPTLMGDEDLARRQRLIDVLTAARLEGSPAPVATTPMPSAPMPIIPILPHALSTPVAPARRPSPPRPSPPDPYADLRRIMAPGATPTPEQKAAYARMAPRTTTPTPTPPSPSKVKRQAKPQARLQPGVTQPGLTLGGLMGAQMDPFATHRQFMADPNNPIPGQLDAFRQWYAGLAQRVSDPLARGIAALLSLGVNPLLAPESQQSVYEQYTQPTAQFAAGMLVPSDPLQALLTYGLPAMSLGGRTVGRLEAELPALAKRGVPQARGSTQPGWWRQGPAPPGWLERGSMPIEPPWRRGGPSRSP